jgi:hypothetical protein
MALSASSSSGIRVFNISKVEGDMSRKHNVGPSIERKKSTQIGGM